MNEKNGWGMTGTCEAFDRTMPEAIFSGTAEIERKIGDPKFIEKIRLLLGFSVMIGGLYFGLFTTGIGEGLGFLALLSSPFVMVADKD
jgi:hypothetical protein